MKNHHHIHYDEIQPLALLHLHVVIIHLHSLPLNFPILSEEDKEIEYEVRKNWEYFWLVDPLDGTKEFISKNDQFTVNIALIHKNFPVIGVVYAPALDVCYWAKKSEGAFKDGKKLPLKQKKSETIKIITSRSHMTNETKEFVENFEKHF